MAHELERLLRRNQDVASGTLRKLQFYRLAVELEQMKEPTSKDWFDMPWTPEPLSVRFVDNAEFKNRCAENLETRFHKDVCVALFVSDGEAEHPLFQCVHQYDDISDLALDDAGSVIRSPLSEFSVNPSVAGDMELEDLQIEALEKYLHGDVPTIQGLKDSVATVIGTEVTLVEKIGVSLSSKNPALLQLVSELQRLGRETRLSGVLADFLENRGFSNQIEKIDPERLVALAPMDDAQRLAVAQALGERVSVVTGPPGCGKTQVILNMLANAVLRGKTVLVSSKNNKAVDTVRDRLIREPGLENAIIRFGSQRVRNEQTIPGLSDMLSVAEALSTRRVECERALNEAKQIHETACDQVTQSKCLIVERRSLQDAVTALTEAVLAAEAHAVEVEAWADQTVRDFQNRQAPYRVFDGYSEAELDGVVTPFRLARNTFSRKYSGLGRLWIDWFAKRKHAAIAIDAMLALPMGMRNLVSAAVELHAADDVRSGNDILAFYRDAEAELSAGLSYLAESVKLMARLRAKIAQANNAVEVAARRKSECLARLAEIAAKRPDETLDRAKEMLNANAGRYVAAAFAKNLSKVTAPASIVAFRNYVQNGIPSQYRELAVFEENVRSFLAASPLLAITSLSAKGALPMATELFDMLIIDEASQCDVASALPLMYRARQIVVIGDPQQLKHISADTLEDERAIKEHLNLINVQYLRYAESSLWDSTRDWLAKATDANKPVMLNGHYRCHPEIIEFSNRMFYRYMGGLVVRTPPFKHPLREQGCHWIDVAGEQVSNRFNVNYAEIDKSIELAVCLATDDPEVSIGLVTPFKAQAEKMHTRISQLSGDLKDRITASTVHKFQGDERDVMIYSLVVTSNSPASKINWIDEGARNLVNVAVTRARQALYVVGNKDYVRTHSASTKPLGALLRYIESLR